MNVSNYSIQLENYEWHQVFNTYLCPITEVDLRSSIRADLGYLGPCRVESARQGLLGCIFFFIFTMRHTNTLLYFERDFEFLHNTTKTECLVVLHRKCQGKCSCWWIWDAAFCHPQKAPIAFYLSILVYVVARAAFSLRCLPCSCGSCRCISLQSWWYSLCQTHLFSVV